MARRPRRGPGDVDGVLVVDKPAGPTSHDVVQRIRRAVGQSRVGHTGTLDPAATGVLVVCLGRAAKLVRFLQAGTKTYAARMALGVTTDSQDADGAVLAEVDASHVDERTLCEALTRFQGEIEQVPPMVSAVKVGGERLHEKARRGEEIDRPARAVTIYDLILDGFHPGTHPEVSFLVTCSAGTYVRTIAHDVGAALGVGGSLTGLRRIANGAFSVDEAHSLDEIDEAASTGTLDRLLVDPSVALQRSMPVREIADPDLVLALTRGARAPALGTDEPIALVAGGRVIGVYRDAPDGSAALPELVWTRPEELSRP